LSGNFISPCYQSILNDTEVRKISRLEETKVAGPSAPAGQSLFCLTGPTVNILATGQRLRRTLISVHLAKRCQRRSFKNQPIRNKSRLWRPCLLMDRDEMSNLYRGPSIDASYPVSVHLAMQFRRRRFLKICIEINAF
jgi:hypothetical protein